MTLYEMTVTATQLYDLFTSGDIPEEAVNDTLESLGVEGKIEDYCHVINQLGSDIASYEAEIERLNAKKQSAKKGIDRMKKAIVAYMEVTNTPKVKAGVFDLSMRKSESVVIDDIDKLPEIYVKVKQTTSPDKTAIKKAIKAGEVISGAMLQVNNNLQIK